MDTDRFELNQGRERPPYQPKEIRCAHCDAQLKQKDERSELIVCEYCGSHLDVSSDEKKVLGSGPGQKWEFPIKIGDSFKWEKSRYEVLARMAFIEDDDEDELTRQYLLFHPHRGSLWLSEYDGVYSLSQDSHIAPREDVFSKDRGDLIETHDGKKWIMEEDGTYELTYVDGALPWQAQIGDIVDYVEFTTTSGNLQYDVQRIRNEIEYGTGRSLSPIEVAKALGKRKIEANNEETGGNAASTRRKFMAQITIAVIVLLFNLIMLISVTSMGKEAYKEVFSPEQLTGEIISGEFTVAEDNDIIKVAVDTNLNNAWMNLDIAVIEKDDKIVHIYDNSISYYHGYEGGESWSEGSTSESNYIKIPKAGTYRLLLKAVSGSGAKAESALHAVQVKIYTGVLVPSFFIFSSIVAVIVLVISIFFYKMWKDNED